MGKYFISQFWRPLPKNPRLGSRWKWLTKSNQFFFLVDRYICSNVYMKIRSVVSREVANRLREKRKSSKTWPSRRRWIYCFTVYSGDRIMYYVVMCDFLTILPDFQSLILPEVFFSEHEWITATSDKARSEGRPRASWLNYFISIT